MSPRCRLAIIAPFYNEAARLPAFLRSLRECVLAADDPEEVGVVLAGSASTDGSEKIVERWVEDLPPAVDAVLIAGLPRGIGTARHTGCAAAAGGGARTGGGLWFVNTETDCVLDRAFARDWLAATRQTDCGLLEGRIEPAESDLATRFPRAMELSAELDELRRLLERAFGLINTHGQNFAVAASAYHRVGGFRQLVNVRHGVTRNLAGEDWDLGSRVRAVGIGAGRLNGGLVRASARRFTASPRRHLTAAAYAGTFSPADDAIGADLRADEYELVRTVARYHVSLHWACKPFLLDRRLRDVVLSAMPRSSRAEISEWISGRPPRSFADEGTLPHDALPLFGRAFAERLVRTAETAGPMYDRVVRGDHSTSSGSSPQECAQ